MKNLLLQKNRYFLRKVSCDTLFTFDYDGTLAPIVKDFRRARMRQKTRRLLAALSRHCTTVIVTGRQSSDVKTLLGRCHIYYVIGNHGLEWERSRTKLRQNRNKVRKWHSLLKNRLRSLKGVALEYKSLSLSIHYRQAPDKARARQQVLAATADLSGIHIIPGNNIVNILPAVHPNKGDALVGLARQFGHRHVVYLGDDKTDESVFCQRLKRIDLLGIRIGKDPTSAAQYYIATQKGIDRFLALVIAVLGSAHK